MSKRGKSRLSSASKRAARYRAKYQLNPVTKRYKKLLPVMYPQIGDVLTKWDALEKLLFPRYTALGIPTAIQPFYTAWAKRKAETCVHLADTTKEKEWSILDDEFILRGLDPDWLEELSLTVGEWCGAFRGASHPLACWYNRCEDLGEWTIHSDFTASIDETDKKEWFGSLKLERNTLVLDSRLAYPISQDPCGPYFGFWVKYNAIAGGYIDIRKRNPTNGHYQLARLAYYSPTQIRIDEYIWDGFVSTHAGPVYFGLGAWLWIEALHLFPSYDVRINGGEALLGASSVLLDLGSAWKVEVVLNAGAVLGTIWFDYWRLAALYEYPPT